MGVEPSVLPSTDRDRHYFVSGRNEAMKRSTPIISYDLMDLYDQEMGPKTNTPDDRRFGRAGLNLSVESGIPLLHPRLVPKSEAVNGF